LFESSIVRTLDCSNVRLFDRSIVRTTLCKGRARTTPPPTAGLAQLLQRRHALHEELRRRLRHYTIQPLVELYGGCMVALKVSWCGITCTAASATHSGRPLAAVRLTQPRAIRTRQRPPT
jgi:hypothetical protein